MNIPYPLPPTPEDDPSDPGSCEELQIHAMQAGKVVPGVNGADHVWSIILYMANGEMKSIPLPDFRHIQKILVVLDQIATNMHAENPTPKPLIDYGTAAPVVSENPPITPADGVIEPDQVDISTYKSGDPNPVTFTALRFREEGIDEDTVALIKNAQMHRALIAQLQAQYDARYGSDIALDAPMININLN